MSRNYMSKFDELRKGDYLWSNNHEWKAVFQVAFLNRKTEKCFFFFLKKDKETSFNTNGGKK